MTTTRKKRRVVEFVFVCVEATGGMKMMSVRRKPQEVGEEERKEQERGQPTMRRKKENSHVARFVAACDGVMMTTKRKLLDGFALVELPCVV